MTEEQKQELKELIEGELSNLFDDLDTAKNDLNVVAKAAEEKYGVKAAVVKRMVKLHYTNEYQEKKEKELEFYKEYESIMEGN